MLRRHGYQPLICCMPSYDFTKIWRLNKLPINPPIGLGLHAPSPPLFLPVCTLFHIGFRVLDHHSRLNGWNSSFRNMPRFSHVKQRPSPQIACRVCDRIFMSSRALVNHLESHMAEDGSISTTQQINFIPHQREGYVSVNQFQSNLSFQTLLQETRLSIRNSNSLVQNPAGTGKNPIISATQFDVSSLQLQFARSNHSFRPQLLPSLKQASQRVIEQHLSEFTKPYIDLLDKPIPEIVELVESDDVGKKVDLTLKL